MTSAKECRTSALEKGTSFDMTASVGLDSAVPPPAPPLPSMGMPSQAAVLLQQRPGEQPPAAPLHLEAVVERQLVVGKLQNANWLPAAGQPAPPQLGTNNPGTLTDEELLQLLSVAVQQLTSAAQSQQVQEAGPSDDQLMAVLQNALRKVPGEMGAAGPSDEQVLEQLMDALKHPTSAEGPLIGGGLLLPGAPPGGSLLLPELGLELPEPRLGRPVIRRRRARIVQPGQLSLIPYGANEALLWTRRIAEFQGALRGVLGDRRLRNPWGGSVLDSVVGAFLTQNVADHLSSRAYMTLASRFPKPAPASTSRPDPHVSFVDWEAVRTAPVEAVAEAIECRGLHRLLAGRIKRFLHTVREFNIALQRKEQRRQAKAAAAAAAAEAAAAAKAAKAASAAAAAAAQRGEGEGGTAGERPAAPEGQAEQEGQQEEQQPERKRRAFISLEYEESTAPAPCAAEPAGAAGAVAEAGLAPDGSALPAEEETDLLSLEWLRGVGDAEANDWLMGVDGLGYKSTACILLLTLGKKAFPVDTNVGRIASRLGWIPLDTQDVGDDEFAPEPEVHSYLRQRLLGFPVGVLQELHYNMISLGKVFCQKQRPNCTACPLAPSCDFALASGHTRHRPRVRQPAPQLFTGAGSGRLHWKTAARLARLQAETQEQTLLEQFVLLRWSELDLDDLVAAGSRGRRRRAPTSRHSRGTSGIGTLESLGLPLPSGCPLPEADGKPEGGVSTGGTSVAAPGADASCSSWLQPGTELGAAMEVGDAALEEVRQQGAVGTPAVGSDCGEGGKSGGTDSCAWTPAAGTEAGESEMDTGGDAGPKRDEMEEGDEQEEAGPAAEEDPSAAAAQAEAEATAHCERLEGLGQQLAEAQRQLMVEAGLPSSDPAAIRQRCMHLSLRILGVDEHSDMRAQYRRLARALHPDKCPHPHAADAFAALGAAFRFASGADEIVLEAPAGPMAAASGATDEPENDRSMAMVAACEADAALPIWTTNRLVVRAWLLPPRLQPALGLPPAIQAELASSGDAVIFLPLRELPSRVSAALAALQDKASPVGASVRSPAVPAPLPVAAEQAEESQPEVAVAGLLGDMLDRLEAGHGTGTGSWGGLQPINCTQEAEQQTVAGQQRPQQSVREERMVRGVLLVGARASLRGSFPLRGSYFQTNEVFALQSTTEAPVEVAEALLAEFMPTAVHVGHSIFFLCRGMQQEEVVRLFSSQYFCCRSVDIQTGAPHLLPEWLMPSTPQKNSHWKSAEERAAEQQERLLRRGAREPPRELVRFVRVPLTLEEAAPPAPVLAPGEEPPQRCLDDWLPSTGMLSGDGAARAGGKRGGSGLLHTPGAKKQRPWSFPGTPDKKEGLRSGGITELGGLRGKGQPLTQEAADRKSGKGRTRRFLHPIIRGREKCGHCAACQNPQWKKACMTRRAEQEAASAGMAAPL